MIQIDKSLDKRRLDVSGIILTAHQPEFLPWLGYVSKAIMGDVYFILDNVQYVKDVFQNRNKIRIKQGDGWQWLNIPLKEAGSHLLNWKDVRIDENQNWKKKHLNAIYYSYSKSFYFDSLFEEIEKLYLEDEEFLLDFIIKISKFILGKFEVNVPIYRTSELIELGYDISGKKSELIINMCKVVNADNFVFGSLGRTYIDKDIFRDNNVNFFFQNFKHPVYKQMHGNFISNMSSIDLLFNHGKKVSVDILGKSIGDDK
jgi:hypothetical protein